VIHCLKQAESPQPDVLVYSACTSCIVSEHHDVEGRMGNPFGAIRSPRIWRRAGQEIPLPLEIRKFHSGHTIELQLPFVKYFFPEAKF